MRRRLDALIQHLRTEHTEPARLGWAVAVGLFVGVLPLYGLHLPLCVAAAVVLRLNKATTILASQISIPPFAPFLVAGGIAVGELVRFGHHRPVGLAHARDFLDGLGLLAGAVPDRFVSCLVGDAVIGLVLGAVGGVLTWRWARRRRWSPATAAAPTPGSSRTPPAWWRKRSPPPPPDRTHLRRTGSASGGGIYVGPDLRPDGSPEPGRIPGPEPGAPMSAVPAESVPAVPPTSLAEVDAKLERLVAGRPRWVARSPEERARLLRACMASTLAVADRWAETARRIKGYAPGSNGHGEEYLGGTLPTMRNLRLFAEALEAGGQPPLPKTWQRPDGQWVARTFPQSLLDRAMLGGVTCDVWIEPGKEPTQGRIYREKAEGRAGDGGLCCVLGAGNQSSIPPMDVLYKLVVDDEVCILKMNPVNEALGPVLEEALRPLVEAGALEICYGGIDVGRHLTDHPQVTSIHITGSAAAHDAIVWGPGPEGEARKKAGTPRIDKPITSELGCVSPVLVVPGPWSDAEIDFHARQVASMLAYNCGFNCNGARLIVVARGWPLRDRFEAAVREKLAANPLRRAYYPTARASWERFLERYPKSTKLGTPADGELPWTVLEGIGTTPGEYALENEPWCGIFGFVDLEATEPADYLARAVPFANDRCWGTLSINVLVHPKTEAALGDAFDRAIADLRYGGIAINCWSGLNYGLVNATWGAFPGHTAEDIQSGRGVVHNGLLLDHPQKSVVRAPFLIRPTPAWFTDHRNNLALGQRMTRFEAAPSWFALPGVALAAFKG